MLSIGVIGCGYWGPNLIRNFFSINDVRISYCADTSESRLSHIKSLYSEVNLTKDYRDVIQDKNVDAVIIATPIETHYKIARECLESGKHVLVEKPITNTSAEAEKLISLADENKKVLMVDHTFEYSAPVRKIKEILDNGELGKIFTIDIIRVNLGLFQEKVNVIADLAPHDISMLVYLLNESPISARAVGNSYIRDGIEDDAHINFEFRGGIAANIHVSWLDPCKIRKTTIVGNRKMLVFDDTLSEEKIKIYDKGVTLQKNSQPMQQYYDTYQEWVLAYRKGEIYSPQIENKEPLSVMASHFIDCIKNNKKPQTDGQCGLRVVKVLEAAQKSLKNDGKKIKIQIL